MATPFYTWGVLIYDTRILKYISSHKLLVNIFINFTGSWSNWSECSVTCGNGIQLRRRACVTECGNEAVEYRECYVGCCPGNVMKHPVYVLYNHACNVCMYVYTMLFSLLHINIDIKIYQISLQRNLRNSYHIDDVF